MKQNRERVQVTLPPFLIEKLDQDAKVSYLTRSSWIERAVIFYLDNADGRKPKQRKIIDLDA